MYRRLIKIPQQLQPVEILGAYNNRVKYIKEKFDIEINYSNNSIIIYGQTDSPVAKVESIFNELIEVLETGHLPDWSEFQYIVSKYESTDESFDPSTLQTSSVDFVNTTISGIKIMPKTQGQATYVKILREKDMVFSIGPAGTGKTYLAVAVAVEYLRSGKVQRIILTRPAVEAGEKLGFLPGTLYEKIDPYLKPLYDSLIDFINPDKLIMYRERGIIEVVPLAYMRGRTLNNSFIILDEAQNTTYQQMKMFLTRVGFNSKVVVTGDITQIDLERKKDSGLLAVRNILGSIEQISFMELDKNDVVRNPLIKEIINAYEIFERDNNME